MVSNTFHNKSTAGWRRGWPTAAAAVSAVLVGTWFVLGRGSAPDSSGANGGLSPGAAPDARARDLASDADGGHVARKEAAQALTEPPAEPAPRAADIAQANAAPLGMEWVDDKLSLTRELFLSFEPQPMGATLQEFWGDEWPAVSEEMLAAGWDMDMPVKVIPQELMEPIFRQTVLLGGSGNENLLRSRVEGKFPVSAFEGSPRSGMPEDLRMWRLDEEQKEALRAVDEEYRPRFERVREDLLQAEMILRRETYESGEYRASPLYPYRHSEELQGEGKPKKSQLNTFSRYGWKLTYFLGQTADPLYSSFKDEYERLFEKRREAFASAAGL